MTIEKLETEIKRILYIFSQDGMDFDEAIDKILKLFDDKNDIKESEEVKYRHFQYMDIAIKWINDNNINLISICSTDKFSEGCYVIYK